MTSAIENKCIKKGVRLTDQRKLVAKVMSESEDHPDVDELHKRISKHDFCREPEIGCNDFSLIQVYPIREDTLFY